MDAIATLRDEHAVLRRKLAFLESALAAAPQARFALREKCSAILRLLTKHMQREQHAIELFYRHTPGVRHAIAGADHSTEHALLRAVDALLLRGTHISLSLLVLRLSEAIQQLERQMTAQEQDIYPMLSHDRPRPTRQLTPRISEGMSVNAIVHRYPQTGSLFDQLRVNRLREGYESVDEVAWRHGVDVGALIEDLQQAAAAFPRYA